MCAEDEYTVGVLTCPECDHELEVTMNWLEAREYASTIVAATTPMVPTRNVRPRGCG